MGQEEGDTAPEPQQEPAAPTPDTAESVQSDATPPNPGPWSADLEAAFDDPNQRAAVDAFLREKVQPRVTQLEQQSAPNRAAERLYDDFTQNPVDTYYSVTEELYGPEAAEAVKAALAGDDSAPDAEDDILDDTDADLSNLPPEAREAIEYVQEQRQEAAYNAELDKIKADKPDLDLDPELFAPFVMAADGDLEVAVENYESFLTRFKPSEGGEPEPTPQAPPTVGQDRTGATTPPTEKSYESLDEAMDEYFAEQRSAPPTVGQV